MYVRFIAGTATWLAMILLFVLALAGCGDNADDTDAHMMDEHEHEHEGGHAEGDVIVSFDDHDGFEKGQSDQFSQSIRPTALGRFAFVTQRSGHLGPENAGLEDNRIYIVDSGLEVEAHGDHFDPITKDPTLLPYQLGHGGGEEGRYNPVHFVSHHGLTAIYYDGINPDSSDPDAVEQLGYAVAYRDSDFGGSTMPPMPIFEMEAMHYSHGAVVPVHEELFIVTLAEEDDALPNGVATYSAHAHGDHIDAELEESFAGRCPGLHGEATWGPYVAFTCYRGEGVLVLTHDDATDSFEATTVAYPDEMLTSGGLAATTLHEDEVGHDDVIFMARYGANQQDFVKITEHDIEDGPAAHPEVLTMEWGSTGRHRAFAFEPEEGSARRLLIQDQDANGENYHLDVLHLGDEDHTGKGRFVVLTATGDLHIFDLATSDEPTTIPGIVGAECPDVGCPRLALAPDFAYVSDPANGKVHVVHLEHAEIEGAFDEGLDAPTELVVLGRFGYELDHSHERHE